MFYRLDKDNMVRLEDVSYTSIGKNQQNLWEIKIFLRQVEHYMYLQYESESDARMAFEFLTNELEKIEN